jgi:imidazolonepropionase-like amidohydrolase
MTLCPRPVNSGVGRFAAQLGVYMHINMRNLIISLANMLVLSFLIVPINGQVASTGKSNGLALVGAKIYPSPIDNPINNGVVLIKNGRITAMGERGRVKIPQNVEILDCAGLTVTAGFWNSHVHFSEQKWQGADNLPSARIGQHLSDMLTRYGFTTVFDTGSVLENTNFIRRRIETREIEGPTILTAGEPLAPQDGTPFYVRPLRLPEVTSPEQARALVREKVKNGADAVKIFSGSLVSEDGQVRVMPLELVKAVTAEAHRLGKPVLAHTQSAEGVKAAVDGGVDILLHTAPEAGRWSDALLTEMRRKNMALVATLKLWKYIGLNLGRPADAVERFQDAGIAQLRAYTIAGGQILFGTDVGFMTDYDPSEEYLAMARAGMTFKQILKSLTTAPAERFGMSKRTGRIAPGMDADIVVLAGDPAQGVKAFSNVRYTLRKGRVVYQAR